MLLPMLATLAEASLAWKDVDRGVDREAFTLRTMRGANLRDVTG